MVRSCRGSAASAWSFRLFLVVNALIDFAEGDGAQKNDPSFSTAIVAQSSPLASASNTITLTLVSNVDLEGGSRVTLSGLTGTDTAEATLRLNYAPDSIEPSAQWTSNSGILTMVIADSGVTAGTEIVLSFGIQNGAQEQTHRSVSISAYRGADEAPIPAMIMDSPEEDLMGVQNGARPLKIVQPRLLAVEVGQRNPLAGGSNVISITIRPSTNIARKSVLTISGLSGMHPVDLDMNRFREPCNINTSTTTTAASQSSSSSLPATTSSTSAAPTSTSTTPTPTSTTTTTVTTTTTPSPTTTHVPTTAALMDNRNTSMCIEQNGTVTLVDNTSANITTNFSNATECEAAILARSNSTTSQNGPASRRIDRQLLQVMTTPPAASDACIEDGFDFVAVSSSPSNVFFRGGQWSESRATLLLHNAMEMLADATVVVNIDVRNGHAEQESPMIRVAGRIEGGTYDSILSLTSASVPGTEILGVEAGQNPLKIHKPDFTSLLVEQSNPWLSGETTLTITFILTFNLPVGSRVVISDVLELESIFLEIPIASESVNGIAQPSSSRSISATAVWNAEVSSMSFDVIQEVVQGSEYELVFNMRRRREPRRFAWDVEFEAVVETGDFDSMLQRASIPVLQDLALASPPRDISMSVDENGIVRITWDLPENTGQSGRASELTGYELKLFRPGLEEPIVMVENGWMTSTTLRDGPQDGVGNQFTMTVNRPLELRLAAVNSAGAGLSTALPFVVGEVACSSRCGDGRVDPDEGCDDGNIQVGDGCSEGCTVESEFVCERAPAQYPCATAKFETTVCRKPRFSTFRVAETTTLPATPNDMVATVQLDATLPANATLAITGLIGASGPSGTQLGLTSVGGFVLSPGTWSRSQGSLTFELVKSLPAGTVLIMSFTLVNPAQTHQAVAPSIECLRCLVDPVIPIAPRASEQRVLGVVVEPPACSTPLFGEACGLTCYGIVNGAFCDCPPGFFSFDCAEEAEVDLASSAPLTLVPAGQQVDVKAPSGAGVSIPAGATTEDVTVSASAYNVRPRLGPEQGELEAIGAVMDMQPDGWQFATEVELALTADAFGVELAGAKGREVHAFFFNTTTRQWVKQGGAFDAAAGLLRVRTLHFSQWTVMSQPPATAPVGTTAPPATQPPLDVADVESDSGVTRIDTDILIVICVLSGVAILCCGLAAATRIRCLSPPQDAQPPHADIEFPVIYKASPGGAGWELATPPPDNAPRGGIGGRPPLPHPATSAGHRAPSPAPMAPSMGVSSVPVPQLRGSVGPMNPYVHLPAPAQIFPVPRNAPFSSLPPSGHNTPRASVAGPDLRFPHDLSATEIQQIQNLSVPVLSGSAPLQLPPPILPQGSAPPAFAPVPVGRLSRHGSFSSDIHMVPPLLSPPTLAPLPPPFPAVVSTPPPMVPANAASIGWPPVREKVAVFETGAPSPLFDRIHHEVPFGFPGNVGRRPAPTTPTVYGV